MPRKIEAWECGFKKFGCKKPLYKTESRATQHEPNCAANPINRTCKTCKKPCPITQEKKEECFCEECNIPMNPWLSCDPNNCEKLDDLRKFGEHALLWYCPFHVLADRFKEQK